MYAVVKSGGRQFRVAKGDKLQVDRLDVEVGADHLLDQVLMVGEGEKVNVGTPTIKGAVVKTKVLSHDRGEKLVGFKYRPRKRYRKRMGFRSSLTTLEITAIEA
jgi:large subunit ribosomal protein L21